MSTQLLLWSAGTGALSALATGLGALIVAAIRGDSAKIRAMANAGAAGMMLTASIYTMAHEGVKMEASALLGMSKVILGIVLGALCFGWIARRFPEQESGEAGMWALDRRSLMVFLALFVHSIPEGLAIGVGFATGDVSMGIVMAVVIALHNIPEGVAMALPMRADGASLWKCFWVAVATSLPQPILAVPATLAFGAISQGMSVGLGFAAGAMIYIALTELLPRAFEEDTRAAAWGTIVGICLMFIVGVLAMGA